MDERVRAWLQRAASTPVLVSMLAVLLLGAGTAAAVARFSSSSPDDVTVTSVTPPPTSPPATGRGEAPSARASTASPAPASPSASPRPNTPGATGTSTPETPLPKAVLPPPATLVPAVTPSLIAPIVQAPASAGVGEAFSLHVIAPGAASVDVELEGSTRQTVLIGERFWLVLGVPVDATPGPRTLRATARNEAGAAIGTGVAPLRFVAVERPVDYLDLTAEQSSVLTEEAGRTEVAMRAAQFSQFDAGRRWNGPFVPPLFGAQTTAFGQGRSINGGPIGGFHSGMDIAAEIGDPVRASAPGRVAWAGEMPIRGRSVIIDHGMGVKTGYHHLNGAFVAPGAIVGAGEVIGAAGSTGLSTGPHLHWELTVWGVNVDPMQWTATVFAP